MNLSKRVKVTMADRISPAQQVSDYLVWAKMKGLKKVTVYPPSRGVINRQTRDLVYTQMPLGTVVELTEEQMEDYS